MDDLNVEQLQLALQLFEKRVTQYDDTTNEILDVLQDTFLLAMCEIMNCDIDNVVWTVCDMRMAMMHVECIATYDSEDQVPPYMSQLQQSDSNNPLERHMKIGLPLVVAFRDKEHVKEHIQGAIDAAISNLAPSSNPQVELTLEQQMMLVLQYKQQKGTTH